MFEFNKIYLLLVIFLLFKISKCTPVTEIVSTSTFIKDLNIDKKLEDIESTIITDSSDGFKYLENKAADAFSDIKEIEENAIEKIGKTGEKLVELTTVAIRNISEYIQRLIVISSKNLNDLSVDSKEFLDKAHNHIENAINKIGEKLLELTNESVKDVFINIKDQLKNVQVQLKELSIIADEKFESVVMHINQTLVDKTTHIDSWIKDLRIELNEIQNSTAHKEACTIVDGFVSGTVNELDNCCNIAIKPVKSVCSRISHIFNETLQVVIDVIEKMDNCIFDKQSDLGVMIPCVNDAYDNVTYLLSKAASIRHSLIGTIPIKIVVSNFCVSFTVLSMDSRKVIIQDEINKKYLKKKYIKF